MSAISPFCVFWRVIKRQERQIDIFLCNVSLKNERIIFHVHPFILVMESGTILSLRLIMKSFLPSFSTFRWFKKGSCQVLVKEWAPSTCKPPSRFKPAHEKCG